MSGSTGCEPERVASSCVLFDPQGGNDGSSPFHAANGKVQAPKTSGPSRVPMRLPSDPQSKIFLCEKRINVKNKPEWHLRHTGMPQRPSLFPEAFRVQEAAAAVFSMSC
jgi:hypothetical protein